MINHKKALALFVSLGISTTGIIDAAGFVGRMMNAANATRLGSFLQRTKATRTKISSAAAGIAGASYLIGESAQSINAGRRYSVKEPTDSDPNPWDHTIPAGYFFIDSKIRPCSWKVGDSAAKAAFFVRFPLTAITMWGINKGASIYCHKAKLNYAQKNWSVEENNLVKKKEAQQKVQKL